VNASKGQYLATGAQYGENLRSFIGNLSRGTYQILDWKRAFMRSAHGNAHAQ